MAHRKSVLFQVGLLMLCLSSQVNGRAVIRNTQIPTVARSNKRICKPSSLEPALKCGCFLFYPVYSSRRRWQFMEDLCLEKLVGSIQSGERYCHLTVFGTDFGSSIPSSALAQLRNEAAAFFSEVCDLCPNETPAPSTLRSVGGIQIGDLSAPRNREHVEASAPAHRYGSRAPVANDDGLSGFTDNEMTRGTYLRISQDSMESTSVSRQNDASSLRNSVNRRMEDLCRTYFLYVGPEKEPTC